MVDGLCCVRERKEQQEEKRKILHDDGDVYEEGAVEKIIFLQWIVL